jgi:hypothetical protein
MSTNIGNQRLKRDRSGENFRKRRRTFDKAGWKVNQAYGADVYIQLRRKGQVFEFKSIGNAWPLPPNDVVLLLLPAIN